MSNNRIPIQVKHNPDTYSTTYHSTSNFGGSQPFSSRLNDMGDESERMKQRMREFEERCKKWREDFFARSGPTFYNSPPSPEFFHRVPPPPASPMTTNVGATFSNDQSLHANSTSEPSFSSTLHKSYLEDTIDGGKVYKVEFEIGDFRVDELEISTTGRTLSIKGDREIKAGSSTETKTFNREITLPEYVDLNRSKAYLGDNPSLQKGSTLSNSSVIAANSLNSILVIEAPVINDLYYSRRSGINSTRSTPPPPPLAPQSISTSTARLVPNISTNTSSTYNQYSPSRVVNTSQSNAQTNTSSASHYSSKYTKTSNDYQKSEDIQKTIISPRANSNYYSDRDLSKTSTYRGDNNNNNNNINNNSIYSTQRILNNSNANFDTTPSTPELCSGYPIYSKDDGCMVYRFDLRGFNQSDIHLSITENKTLQIKAVREINDSLGKTYREFKRDIQLDESVNPDLIKNVLSLEGFLTLKIPQQEQQYGKFSTLSKSATSLPTTTPATATATSTLRSTGYDTFDSGFRLNGGNNGFHETYANDGRLTKLTCDLTGYDPDDLKITLSLNNELKVLAQKFDTKSGSTRIQKQSTRQYKLPSYIQPESMKAIMSRDGVLAIDFQSQNKNDISINQKINIKS